MLGPLSTKKLLMQRENTLFPTTKTKNSPSFLPGIIEWVKFMSVQENNLLWSREQMNGKKLKWEQVKVAI